jgi:predicted lipoprotein
MKKFLIATIAVASVISLSACNKQDTPQAQNVVDVTENMADNIDEVADNMATTSGTEMMENKADAMREAGENKADRIDDAADNGASSATLNAMESSAKKVK